MKFFNRINKHPFIKYGGPVYIVMLVILFFSLTPKPFTTIGVEQADTALNFDLLHILAYFVLSFLMGVAFQHSKIKILKTYHYHFSIFFSLLFSGFNELMQFLIPGNK